MFCHNCGGKLPDSAKYCPYCGHETFAATYNEESANSAITNHVDLHTYNACVQPPTRKWHQRNITVILLFIFFWPVGLTLMWVNKQWNMIARVIITIIFAFGLVFLILNPTTTTEKTSPKTIAEKKDNDTTKKTNLTEDIVKPETETQDTDSKEETIPEFTPDYDALSDEEYKNACQELWHDDIFFSKDDMGGQLVKLNLFVNEERFFSADAIYDYSSSEIIKKYDLKRDILVCGVQRKNEYSYVGGEVYLYFSNKYDIAPSSISAGNHLTIYGEIISYATTTVDGYNDCRIVPRYVENKN